MRLKSALLVACFVLVIDCGVSLFAEPEQSTVCCNGVGDCGDNSRCCDAASVGQPPCSADAPGICMPACIPTRR